MIDPKRKIIFVHPEKSGGSSVESAFGSIPVSDAKHADDRPYVIKRSQVWPLSRYKSHLGDDFQSYRKIAIVRNPVDRFVSRHRYFIRTDKALYNVIKDKLDGFGVWPELLREDIRQKSRGSFNEINQQSTKLGDLGEYDYIMRLETIDSDWPAMLDKLDIKDLPRDIGHANSSGDTVDALSYIIKPIDRAKLALHLRADLDAFHYQVGRVSASDRLEINRAAKNFCKTGTCGMDAFIAKVFTFE